MASTSARVDQAYQDCMVLLMHLQRKGTQVDAKLITDILGYGAAQKTNSQTVAQEEAVVCALGQLATLAKPASVDGIEATEFQAAKGHGFFSYLLRRLSFGQLSKDKDPPPLAFESALAYAALAISVLIVLLLILLGATTQISLFQSIQQSDAVRTKAGLELLIKQSDLAASKQALTTIAKNTPEYDAAAAKVSTLNGEIAKLNFTISDAAESWKVDVDVLISQRSSILRAMNYPIRLITGNPDPLELRGVDTASDLSSADRKTVFTAIRLSLIESLAFYIPAIAAYLGALAYALRGIAREIIDDCFTEESRMQYRLRSALAPLVGLAAGMLTSSNFLPTQHAAIEDVVNNAISGTLSTGVLALQFTIGFVVGYSIEVVFSVADKIIAGFNK